MYKVILFSSFLLIGAFILENSEALAVDCPATGNWDGSSGICIPLDTGLNSPGGQTGDPVSIIVNNVMRWLLRIIGAIAVIAFVISGIQYITSAGNENQIDAAKRQMKWSIVGVIVALAGLIILNEIYCLMAGVLSPACLFRDLL